MRNPSRSKASSSRTPAAFDVLESPLDGAHLVEASAGTGKTWNICGLYLRLLLERRLEVGAILVVTFTNAATAELRERVRSRIVEMLAHADGQRIAEPDPFVATLMTRLEARGVAHDEIRRRLEYALQAFDEAAIFTIHGFCQRALSELPFETGLPFAFDIQPDDSGLTLDVVRDFWRRHVASDDCPPALAAWLDAKRVTPETLAKLFARHLAKPRARIVWPKAIDAPVAFDLGGLHARFEQARATWHAEREAILAAIDKALPGLNRLQYQARSIEQAATEWDDWLGHDALMRIKWKDAKLERFTPACLQPKTGHAPACHAFFEQAQALIDARRAAETDLEHARLRLVRTLFEQATPDLIERKRRARLASYDDLLQNLDAALRHNPGLAQLLRDRFPVALIDEFQDTDPVQFAIFDAIYGKSDAPLFLVGDPKQAIYGFRHADLHTYLRAARHVGSRWTLTENQRATGGLIRAVNALFGANARAFMLDGLDYHDARIGRTQRKRLDDRAAPRPDLTIWRLPRFDGSPLERRTALEASATATAAEIAMLLRASAAGEIRLGDAPLAPDDIAVLVRSHRQGDRIKQALAALGVGSVELSQATVFKSPDAEEVSRALAAMLDPGDGGLLRAALATQIFGLDAAAVAALADDETTLLEYVQRFLAYRETWVDDGVGVMYRALLTKEGVATRMLARPDGERRLTNLLHLGELLHAAAQPHRAPDALLRWLDAQRRDDARDEVAQLRLESDRNLVQIVTIHKVKGLEFPVVFCPFLWDAFQRTPGEIEGREYHDDDGAAIVDFRGDDELGVDALRIKERIRLEASAESVRLMYVALTRASHRAYLIAGCYGKPTRSGEAPKETRCGLLNWLVAGEAMTAEQWLEGGCTAKNIDDAWARLGDALGRDVACVSLPTDTGTRLSIEARAPESVAALPAPKQIPAPWRIGSFSGLHHGAVSESAASDHDALDESPAIGSGVATTPPREADDDILRFPRGIGAGDCLHAVLERVDFGDPGTWDDAIARALRRHPVSLRGVVASDARSILARMIARMIGDVVRTQLPDGIRLDAIDRTRRIAELEFEVPVRRLDAALLNAGLKSLGYAVDRLTFARLTGYLKGFIDLVFEHGGRYYVLDWKSNHLGDSPADYGEAALALAMARHGYHLQALLYSIALTRYLAHRVRDYRHDRHFGGVLYVFVRGVRPDWKSADGKPTGVYFDRPEASVLAHIDGLLTGLKERSR
jgi:exodeoxyribonuclease V beta subunit